MNRQQALKKIEKAFVKRGHLVVEYNGAITLPNIIEYLNAGGYDYRYTMDNVNVPVVTLIATVDVPSIYVEVDQL